VYRLAESDRAVSFSPGLGLGALAASVLSLLFASWIYVFFQSPEGANTNHSKTIAGRELVARMGNASIQGSAVLITNAQLYNGQKHSLVSKRTKFPSESYSFLKYNSHGLNTGQTANLIWRTATNPKQLFTTPIPRNFGRKSTLNLRTNANWSGNITELGIHIYGDLRDSPVQITSLQLEPYSWPGLVAAAWSEWTSFGGWSGKSINYLKLTPGPPGIETVSPTLVMALWSGFALLLLFLLSRYWRKVDPVAYGIVALIPWIALDLLWQRELSTQLHETRYLFAGKSMHDRHLADYYSAFYSYALRLKSKVLPKAPQRIFLLHDSDGLNFDRLKTHYYLLPHNVYAYGRHPVKTATKGGDYILMLGPIPKLMFDDESGLLQWGDDESLTAELVDKDKGRILIRAVPKVSAGTVAAETESSG